MRDIIIASGNNKAAERIRIILQSGQLFVSDICASGSEVLSFASIRTDAVIVCGKLSDNMPAPTLAEMLPNGFDVVWLLPSGQPQIGYVSNMITLNMPLNRIEFLNTVRVLAVTESEVTKIKTIRSDEDKEILKIVKERLMDRHHISEREAHKLIQKRSMETGTKMIDVAKMIGEED